MRFGRGNPSFADVNWKNKESNAMITSVDWYHFGDAARPGGAAKIGVDPLFVESDRIGRVSMRCRGR